MANARKILIVDDDTDLRDTLVEQLSLHDEFEASAVALALVGDDSAPPQRNRHRVWPGGEPAPAGVTGGGTDQQRRKRLSAFHFLVSV